MKVFLTCTECEYQKESSTERGMMNNIIMWNHSKKAHPRMAERIIRTYQTLPDNLYGVSHTVRATQ